MAQATERLQRYLEDELGECRSEDVERRLEELDTLETGPSVDVEAELRSIKDQVDSDDE